MATRYGRRRFNLIMATLVGLAGISAAVVLPAAPASAASQNAEITISPGSQSQPTGAAQTYNINIACLGTGASECGPNTTITIPLDATTTPPMTDPSWLYSATTGSAGLILGQPTVVGKRPGLPRG